MATPQNGKGQTETRVISQGPDNMEVVLITTYPDGRRTSRTVHHRLVHGNVKYLSVNGGRHKQNDNGEKPYRRWAA